MEIKCEYCGSMIPENAEKCPYCGATNNAIKRTADGTPKTIGQLQQWYRERNLPPYEVTRFFIGVNYTEPKAFGIYKEGNDFVVYKNKANGERAIRYRGTDEAYAVNELYLKLKDEILNQKAHNQGMRRQSSSNTSRVRNAAGATPLSVIKTILIFILVIVGLVAVLIIGGILEEIYAGLPKTIVISVIVAIFVAIFSLCFINDRRYKSRILGRYSEWIDNKNSFWPMIAHYAICVLLVGAILIVPIHNYSKVDYYRYDDTVYVNSHYGWFEYDGYDYDKIDKSDVPTDMLDNKTAYGFDYSDNDWNSNFTEFEDSNYYDEHYSSSDSDSDYDWDSNDSWDSGGSDWDSDW